eukprot:2853620-Rhodomonas_salina.1
MARVGPGGGVQDAAASVRASLQSSRIETSSHRSGPPRKATHESKERTAVQYAVAVQFGLSQGQVAPRRQ